MVDSIPYIILAIHLPIFADLIIDWGDSEIKRLENQVSNKLNNAYVRSFQ